MNTNKKNVIGVIANHLHPWLFFAFLITFPLTIRKVLVFYPMADQFNEYTGIYLYLSDIFLMLTILAWGCSILYNNKSLLSNIGTATRHFTNVPRETLFVLPLLLVIWSFISLFWAESKNLALFRSLKMAEFYGLFVYILAIVPHLSHQVFHVEHLGRDGTVLKRIVQIIIASGLIQSLTAIWQVIIQKSIGLHILGESIISPTIAGVAKLDLFVQKFIRAYGLFPHPNILGGFLLISIILTLTYRKMFHVEQESIGVDVPRGTSSLSHRIFGYFGLNKVTFKFLLLFAFVQFLALLGTFSKSALLGLLTGCCYIFYKTLFPVKTGFHNIIRKLFHVKQSWRRIVLISLICLVLGFIILPNKKSLLFKSLEERLLYIDISRKAIMTEPWFGSGNGQFVVGINKNVPHGTILADWQFQPVHNVFLLIWSELGIIGLGLFVWWLWKLFHPSRNEIVLRGTISIQSKTLRILKGALLGLIFIMFFDHYLWDIQQGQILLWLIVGLIAGFSRDD